MDKGASPCAVDFEGKTALMHASGRGRLDCVNWLLERGAEVNAVDCKGVSALMEAANGCRDDCVEILLAAGADVCAADGEGRTALWFAVSKGDFKSTQALAAAHPEGLVGQAQWQMAHGLANMVGGGCLSAMEREFFLRCVGRAEELSAASV